MTIQENKIKVKLIRPDGCLPTKGKGGTWDLGGSPLYFGSPTAGLPNNQILHTIDGVAITNAGLVQICQMRNGEITFANGSSLSANEDCYGFYINNSGQKNATGNKIVFAGCSTVSCAKNFYGDHDNEQLTVAEAAELRTETEDGQKAEKRAVELRHKIKNLGNINLDSVDATGWIDG